MKIITAVHVRALLAEGRTVADVAARTGYTLDQVTALARQPSDPAAPPPVPDPAKDTRRKRPGRANHGSIAGHITTAKRADPRASWRDLSACEGRGAEMAGEPEAARRICFGCPVLDECRAWVLSLPSLLDPGGVCGGLSEDQRTRGRISRAHKARAAQHNADAPTGRTA